MRAPARLALYGAGLAVAFGGSYGLAGALVPDQVVESWVERGQTGDHVGPSTTEPDAQHDSTQHDSEGGGAP